MITVFRDGIIYYIYLLREALLLYLGVVVLTCRVSVLTTINVIICFAAPRDLSYVLAP
jgi:hypothetical protein